MPAHPPICIACGVLPAMRLRHGGLQAFCTPACLTKWSQDELRTLYNCCPKCGRWSLDSEWVLCEGFCRCPECGNDVRDPGPARALAAKGGA